MALRLLLLLVLLAATLLTAQAQGEGHEALLPTGWDGAGDMGARRGLHGVLCGAVAVHRGCLRCIWVRAWLQVWGLQCSCV